ncbi:MAG: type sorting protein [Rickettsiaceae bacterium]|jgi:prepilin-type N-terminal cleavage/methylation domain-containing protein|nr:type sorting protein [Rickettsiaceae bacterium]
MIKKQSGKTGFSLLELVVVSVIISALIGAASYGKLIINSARLRIAQTLTAKSPIQSIPDLALWLETTLDGSITSANATTNGGNLSNNDPVSSWNDISNNKINLTQATTNNRPTYIKNGINFLPSLSFNGTSSFLSSTRAPIDLGAKKHTMIIVWKPFSSTQAVLVDQKPTGSAIDTTASLYINNTGSGIFGFSTRYSVGGNTIGIPITINNSYISAAVFDASLGFNAKLYLNGIGSDDSTSTLYEEYKLGNDIFLVGATSNSGTPSLFANAWISEVIIFNRNLTPLEMGIINKYLSQKYNITLS